MNRRLFLLAVPGTLVALRAGAHHGWSSFDETQAFYFEGKVAALRWQNPHAEVDLEVAAGLTLPADLARLAVPAQQATVDAARILGGAKPAPRAGLWTCELAPLTRIAAWQVPEPRVGDRLAVVGYIRPQSPELRMRADFVIADGRVYPLRSLPAG
jgi:hypothetical protein